MSITIPMSSTTVFPGLAPPRTTAWEDIHVVIVGPPLLRLVQRESFMYLDRHLGLYLVKALLTVTQLPSEDEMKIKQIEVFAGEQRDPIQVDWENNIVTLEQGKNRIQLRNGRVPELVRALALVMHLPGDEK